MEQHISITRAMVYGILLSIVRTERKCTLRETQAYVFPNQLSRYEMGLNYMRFDVLINLTEFYDVDLLAFMGLAEHIWFTIQKTYALTEKDLNTRPRNKWLERLVRNSYRAKINGLLLTTENLNP